MIAISEARWQEAQKGELEFWNGGDRRALASELHALYARELSLSVVTVAGKSVLDLGAGPFPIGAALALPLHAYVCIDPIDWNYDPPDTGRVVSRAEEYRGPYVDECWGYNVLQHVLDPRAVINVAKAHAPLVRWFDWIDTPVESHHPHSISADWLLSMFAEWRIVSERRGTSHSQRYVALVAERP
jgi:hypothetical protein